MSKPNEMLGIAKELYNLSKKENAEDLPPKDKMSRVKFLEECYLTAVRKVLNEEKKKTLDDRWDVKILSIGVHRVEKIQNKCESVKENLKKRAKKINDRVRWTGRIFNEELRKRAKSCENVRKIIVKRVRSQGKRVSRVYNSSSLYVKKTLRRTKQRTTELKLKMHKGVDSMIKKPIKKLSSSCRKRVKPYYDSAKSRISRFATHTFQAASDLKDSVIETSVKRSAHLRARTVDVVLPLIHSSFDDAKQSYQKTKDSVLETVEPVAKTVGQNRISMKRLLGFTWEVMKDAFAENLDLTKQFVSLNKEHVNRYLGDVDFELFYTRNRSLSVRDFLVKSKEMLMGVVFKKAQEDAEKDLEIESYEEVQEEEEDVQNDEEDVQDEEEDVQDEEEDMQVEEEEDVQDDVPEDESEKIPQDEMEEIPEEKKLD